MFFASLFLNLIYLVSFVTINCVGQDQFTIIRSSAGSRKDLFLVPRCSSSSLTCSALYSGATNHDPTQCKCACRHEYSTFGYYNGTWICMSNRKIRQQPGCQFLFDGEADYNPLRVLSTGSAHQVMFPSIDCTIDQSASRYRKCDGTWTTISVQSNIFWFLPLTETLGYRQYRYTMKVGAVASLAGRIVSLKVNCARPSKSSCVLFKVAGQIKCPVDIVRFSSTQTSTFTVTNPSTTQSFSSDASTINSSTEAPGLEKGASNSGEKGRSSGTVAAVIVIILVIIVVAVVGFVFWKRRRGENILLMDHLISIARKFRSPPSTKKTEEPEEQIYAEITEQPAAQRLVTYSSPAYAEVYNFALNDPNSAYAGPNQQHNRNFPKIPDEAPTDERGYMVPVDSPFYNRVQENDHQNTDSNGKSKNLNTFSKSQDHQRSTHGDGVGNNDVAPLYVSLEVPDGQNTKHNDRQTSVYTRQPNSPDRGGTGSSFLSPSAVLGTEGSAGDNRFVAKQRRRPPSPPRKIK
ncbi:uncharacterized protein LOC116304868 [Actinia tenebrosa]|uniref:Uncharacterized protein LOC116304868 n=1 Tax=Actinia tenebrosa TaxID=6105 RepID=A0A6P8IX38_ACTTE|nr:uncharacterized protein LOC116304868 [Actinia tenebrosa]